MLKIINDFLKKNWFIFLFVLYEFSSTNIFSLAKQNKVNPNEFYICQDKIKCHPNEQYALEKDYLDKIIKGKKLKFMEIFF